MEADHEQGTVTLYIDNQSAIKMANNNAPTGRTKHIAIRYHILNEAVERAELRTEYVPTEENLADIFTKPLTAEKFEFHRKSLLIPQKSTTLKGQ